jgi:hypothetical protein
MFSPISFCVPCCDSRFLLLVLTTFGGMRHNIEWFLSVLHCSREQKQAQKLSLSIAKFRQVYLLEKVASVRINYMMPRSNQDKTMKL